MENKINLQCIEEAAQLAFDKIVKPVITKEMKRLKIKTVQQVMGVIFITLNNGKEFSDTEFEESSSIRKQFLENYIYPLQSDPFYTLINSDITL